jgi:MYXO-CTERM domain-containing protein
MWDWSHVMSANPISEGRRLRVGRFVVMLGLACGALALPRAAAAQAFSISTTSGVDTVRNSRASDWWMSGAGLIDLDGDGDLDLFLSSHGSYGSLTALNDGKGHFSLATGTFPKSELLLPSDVDNDGKVDFTATYADGGGQWWTMQPMAGTVSFLGTKITRDGGQARQQALMDFDGDGKIDWLRGAGMGVLVDVGDGKGGFTATPAKTLMNPGGEEIAIVPVDVDGDGDQDLFVEWGRYDSYGPDGATRLYRNDGGGKYTNVSAAAGLTEMGLAIQGVGDFDQDGDNDFIALEKRAFPNSIFLNDGHGVFTKKAGAITGMTAGTAHYASWGLAAMTDLDNDGIPDLLVDGRNYLKVLRGTGGGSFEYVNKTWGGIVDTAEASVDNGFAFGDIDGDGDLDLIGYKTIEPRRDLNVYVNNLPAKNWLNVRAVGLPGNKAAAGAEIRVFAPGTTQLLWYEEISLYSKQVQQNYYAMGDTERHIGLGSRATVDVTVRFHPSNKVVRRAGVAANSTVRISEDGAGTIVPPPAQTDAGAPPPMPDAGAPEAKPAADVGTTGAAGAGAAGTGAAGLGGSNNGAAGTGAAGTPPTTGAAGDSGAAGTGAAGAAGAPPTTGAAGAAGTGAAGAPGPRQQGDDGGCSCAVGDGGAAPAGALLLALAALAAVRRPRAARARSANRGNRR